MEILLILVVIGGVFVFSMAKKIKSENEKSTYNQNDINVSNVTVSSPVKLEERLEKPAGDYEWYSLTGMQYRGLNKQDYGIFEGKAIADTNNQYDKYAVGIHRADNGKLIGYIRKGENEELHNYIMKHGGSVHASFRVWERDGNTYACAFVNQKVER